MNLESLKARNAANITKLVLEDGSEWHCRKLTAAAGIAVGKAFQAAGHTDPDGPEPPAERLIEAYSILLSKTLCNEAGEMVFDNDECRAELQKLDFAASQELSLKAQEWSGLGESKKN